MDSEDSIDVSGELAVDKDVRSSLDIVQAVVGAVEVIILVELPHDSELQNLNLALRHMEATSGIFFDDAVRINKELDPLWKEVGRPGSLGNITDPLETTLGSVPSYKNNSLTVPCVGIYPSQKLSPNGSQISGSHYAWVCAAQPMDAIELIVPN